MVEGRLWRWDRVALALSAARALELWVVETGGREGKSGWVVL
jgi:hypothetical protein